MPNTALAVALGENHRLSSPLMLPAGKGITYIRPLPGQRVVLSDAQTAGQPEQLVLKRAGNNLVVSLPGEDEPRLVIYDYYQNQLQLEGIGTDGQPHYWAITEGAEEPSQLSDGTQAFAQLSDDSTQGGAFYLPEHNSGMWAAMGAFAALLGLAAVIPTLGHQHGGSFSPEPPPPAPHILSAMDNTGIYTGTLASGGLTDDAQPVFSGSGGVPGNLISLYADGVFIGSATVAEDGSWTITPDAALLHSEHQFTATETSASGLISAPSATFTLNIDLVAPDAPLVSSVIDETGMFTGSLNNGDVTDETRPLFSGSAEPGARVVFMLDGEVLGSTQAQPDGSWQWRSLTPLADGVHSFTAQATDPAGNTGLPSEPFLFTVDTVAPLNNGIAVMADSTHVSIDNALSNDSRPTLSGSGEPGALLRLYNGDNEIGSMTVPADGNWTWQPTAPLADETYQLSVSYQDVAGNVSERSLPQPLEIDTTPPAQPIINAVRDAVPGGVENNADIGNNGITNDARPTMEGEAEPGALIKLYDATGTLLVSFTADSNGHWLWQPQTPLAEGAQQFIVTATDKAGNTSIASAAYHFTVDTIAPLQPQIVSLMVGAVDPHDVGNNGLTNDNRPALNGMAEKNSLISLYDADNNLVATFTTDAKGEWHWQPTQVLADGSYNWHVTATDLAGNISPDSATYTFTVDTAAPAQPVITTAQDYVAGGVENGEDIGNNGITNDNKPVINGSAEKNCLIKLFNSQNQLIGSVMTDSNGVWRIEIDTPLPEGEQVLYATATSPAGNTSVASVNYHFTVDTVAPENAEILQIQDFQPGGVEGGDNIGNHGLTNDNQPNIVGKAEPLSHIRVTDQNGNVIGTTTTNAEGEWQIKPSTALQDGDYSLTVSVTDAAGNTTMASDIWDFTVDTTPYAAPVISTGTDNAGALEKPLPRDAITGDTTPTFTGSSAPNALIILYDNGVEIGSFQADSNGAWQWTLPELSEGMHSLTTVAVDPAGNPSSPSAAYDFKVGTVWDFNDNSLGGWKILGLHATDDNTFLAEDANGGYVLEFITKTGADFSGDVMSIEIDVVAGKTYDFNFTLSRVLDYALVNPAQLAFAVNGVEVSDYYTVTDTPQKVEGSWVSDFTGKVTLSIVDKVKTSHGNDFWVDDIGYAVHETPPSPVVVPPSEHPIETQQDTPLPPIELGIDDVLSHGTLDLFQQNGNVQLMVTQDDTQSVTLHDLLPDGSDSGEWNKGENITLDNVDFRVYQHNELPAEILIQHDIDVNLNNH